MGSGGGGAPRRAQGNIAAWASTAAAVVAGEGSGAGEGATEEAGEGAGEGVGAGAGRATCKRLGRQEARIRLLPLHAAQNRGVLLLHEHAE